MATTLDWPRYLPDVPLPPYAFVPGQTPHPHKDPRGHSHGRAEPAAEPLTPSVWSTHRGYLFGIDLYNHGFPWEAHESWEGPWRLAARETPERRFLQGLIQCTAAAVKALAGQVAGVRSLSGTGLQLLRGVAATTGPAYMGLRIEPFASAFAAFAAAYPANPTDWPRIQLTGWP